MTSARRAKERLVNNKERLMDNTINELPKNLASCIDFFPTKPPLSMWEKVYAFLDKISAVNAGQNILGNIDSVDFFTTESFMFAAVVVNLKESMWFANKG